MMKWQMRRIQDIGETLKEIPYPDPTSTAVQTDAVPCIYILPEYVLITDNDENKVGVCWDERMQQWSTDYIEDLDYHKKELELWFKNTRKFTPMAYLQHKCTDFPYDSWYIRASCFVDYCYKEKLP
jgi:hypothetical protein